MDPMARGNRMRRKPGLGALMLAMRVAQIGLEHIPPVTLFVAGINVALFYFDIGFHEREVCIGAPDVFFNFEVKRLLYAALYHWNEYHLSYNITSFLLKGRTLEPILGGPKFGWLLLCFAVMSNALSVVVAVLAWHFGYPNFMAECAVGFSSVLFALKVVLNFAAPGNGRVMFLPWDIPLKYIAWVELVMIQLLIPNASFLGHLCGIVVGLVYAAGYLSPIFNLIDLAHLETFNPQQYVPAGGGGGGGGGGFPHGGGAPRFYGGGPVGGAPRAANAPPRRDYRVVNGGMC